jgi:hypothetical protein
MRPSRLLLLLLAILTAGGCVHTAAPPASSAMPEIVPGDLDSFAYARHFPAARKERASPQSQPQPAPQPQEAHAHAVIPVAEFPDEPV